MLCGVSLFVRQPGIMGYTIADFAYAVLVRQTARFLSVVTKGWDEMRL